MEELEGPLTRRPLSRVALRTALAYAAVAGLYILASDALLGARVADPGLLARISAAKGLAFVVVTSLLLYGILRRELLRWEREAQARERLEDRLRQGQKLEAIGRLAGGIAHDFNNVLTVVRGHAELLLPAFPPGHRGRDSVVSIEEAAGRASALTRQLLAFSRQQVLAPRVVRLNDVVSATEKILRRAIGEDIVLNARLSPAVGAVEVDPGQIEQVLLNLALNARDAMPEGGELTLETRLVECASPTDGGGTVRFAVLAVTDSGCGMTPEVRARVFEPFFTTKTQGHGLGLATAFGIVQQFLGRIEIETEVGVGSSFQVYLPEVEAVPASSVPPAASAEPGQGGETVLLVEDEPAVRQIARWALEDQGYRVLAADGGDEALAMAATHDGRIDLLLTDLVMPRMGGLQLADRLRTGNGDLRILFMSGYGGEAFSRNGLSVAGGAFLEKPFSPQALVAKVREVLDSARGNSP